MKFSAMPVMVDFNLSRLGILFQNVLTYGPNTTSSVEF